MSFHDDLLPLLRNDLAAALSLPAEAVYAGDQPQKIARQGLEVWIQPGPGSTSQAGALRIHPYVLHLRLKTRRGPSLTGADEIAEVGRGLEAIQGRYNGARPFAPALPPLIAVQLEGASVEADSDTGVLEGNLQLKILEA